jgi:hypothetical protein
LTTPQLGISVESDVVLVRAAILYADQVELVSPAAQMLASIERYGSTGRKDALSLFGSLDDETMLRLGLDARQLEMWHSLKDVLRSPDSIQRLQRRLGPTGYAEFRQVLDEMRDQMASVNNDLDEIIQAMLSSSGYTEFRTAIDLGLLRLGDSRMVDDDSVGQSVGLALARQRREEYEGDRTEDEVQLYTKQLSRMVTDRSRMVLLDSGARELVDAMVSEGLIAPVGRPRRLMMAASRPLGMSWAEAKAPLEVSGGALVVMVSGWWSFCRDLGDGCSC